MIKKCNFQGFGVLFGYCCCGHSSVTSTVLSSAKYSEVTVRNTPYASVRLALNMTFHSKILLKHLGLSSVSFLATNTNSVLGNICSILQ